MSKPITSGCKPVASKTTKTPNVVTKRCGGLRGKKGCGAWKPIHEFGKNRSRPDGRQAYCLRCDNARVSKYKAEHPEYRETLTQCPSQRPNRILARVFKHRYGMTIQQRDAMVREQGNACGRCREPFKSTRDTQLDHDHTCPNGCSGERSCGECIRGVVCQKCNAKLSIPYCRNHRHSDPYLVRYALGRALKDALQRAEIAEAEVQRLRARALHRLLAG